jgi:hypothetical protein
MKNDNMKSERITDRTIYSMFVVYNCSYHLNGGPLSDRTCTMRINRAYRKLFEQSLTLQCPWTLAGIKKTMSRVYSTNSNETIVDCTHAIQIEVEDPNNAPEKLGMGFISLVLDNINNDHNNGISQANITSPIAVEDIIKGYLQVDNTIYFPPQI